MYAPDTSYSDVRIDLFYENLEDRDNIIPRKYKKMNSVSKWVAMLTQTGKMYMADSLLAA